MKIASTLICKQAGLKGELTSCIIKAKAVMVYTRLISIDFSSLVRTFILPSIKANRNEEAYRNESL